MLARRRNWLRQSPRVRNAKHRKHVMKNTVSLTLAIIAAGLIAASAADVKENWEKSCAKCHGPDGKGETKLGKKSEVKDMTDAKWQSELKEEKAFQSVKGGIKDGDKIRMKAAEGLTE